MTNPEYAIEFIKQSTSLIATMLGFSIISWIFWWENFGKNSYVKNRKISHHKLGESYKKFEQKILNKILLIKMPIVNKRLAQITRHLKLDLLYKELKNKTEEITFKTDSSIQSTINTIMVIFILILILLSSRYLVMSSEFMILITDYSSQQLSSNPNFKTNIDIFFESFKLIIIIFTLYIVTIVFHTLKEENNKDKINEKLNEIY